MKGGRAAPPAAILSDLERDGRADTTETDRIRAIYDRNAARYDRHTGDGGWLIHDGRSWLAGQARGETLEVGIGTGLTIPWYPADVRLTGIELSPAMLGMAAARARATGREVDLRVGDATALPFADGSFDTVAFCLVLCTVRDDALAFAEALRVLRPGGRVVLLEHVRSPNRAVRLLEHLMQPIGLRTQGDHLLREPFDHVRAHGLGIELLERHTFGVMERLVAVKPEA